MSERHDIEQVVAALEDARTVMSRGVAEGLSEGEALEHLKIILDDVAVVRSLSRIRRRPIARLTK